MAQIKPFKGLLYNKNKIKDISAVVAPPYDIISPDEQQRLYRQSPYNVVRLILGKEFARDNDFNNRYTRAAGYLEDWPDKNILQKDKEEAFYIYTQDYTQENKKKTRYGLIALLELEHFSLGKVLPHEVTSGKPKEDRAKLLEKVRANLSPVFTIFPDRQKKITRIFIRQTKGQSLFDFKSGGVRQRLFRLSDKKIIAKLKKLFRDKTIFIADGHHRYEAALSLKHIYNYIMVYLVALNDEGLSILPTHRLVKLPFKITKEEILNRLSRFFEVQKVSRAALMFGQIKKQRKSNKAFGLFLGGRDYFVLKLNKADKNNKVSENLDVSLLHRLIFKKILKIEEAKFNPKIIYYTRDVNLALSLVNKHKYDAVFFLNPTKLSQVKDMATSKLKMPHKSTYFYPKPLSGLVINTFNQG